MLLLYNESDNKYYLFYETSYYGIKNEIFEFNNNEINIKTDIIKLFNFDSNQQTTYNNNTRIHGYNIILFENIYDDIYIPKISNNKEAIYFLCICHKYMDFEMLDLIFNKLKQFISFDILKNYLSGPFYNYYINILTQKNNNLSIYKSYYDINHLTRNFERILYYPSLNYLITSN